MKSLFPEMDKEIREDRKAARRELVQRARDWLKDRDLKWLIEYLLEKGPTTEHVAMIDVMDDEFHREEQSKRSMEVIVDLWSLWLIRKLWRKPLGKHFGSGEETFLYGIRGVHGYSSAGSASQTHSGGEKK